MREIKFRGISKRIGEFVYGSYIQTNVDAPAIVFGDGEQEEIRPVTLGQYTGLKDKNGVKIFDGDIISYWDGSMFSDKNGDYYPNVEPYYFSKSKNKIVEVIYRAPSFAIRGGNPLMSQYLKSGEIEVIGNIHQHPELLEGKND